jgi:hypothetical protein
MLWICELGSFGGGGYLLSVGTFAILPHRSMRNSVETETLPFPLSTQILIALNRINFERINVYVENIFNNL